MNDNAIEAERHGPVLVLRMADAAHRNVLSQNLLSQLAHGFAVAEQDEGTRVVILAGLPDVFSLGASREALLAFTEGADVSRAESAVSAPMRCALPVVASIRGHAISGGLLLGMYADIAVLSDRSCYGSNFMRYGICPMAGATHVLGARLGDFLANEMLLTARNYQGSELRRRGAPVEVVGHDDVEGRVMAIAKQMASAPRRSLVLLKRHRTAQLQAAVCEAYAHEVTTFETLMALPETRRRIEADYPTWAGER
ncbi:Putative polyketide biosynthesis enoyl-CoA isomerase PksI (plasmid) [Streptomyces sp. YIM 121038]|uniref:polyketide synthase n=1 Tax=Streptomyces sp. YIM 121038 TaxID=2136401 RepID=UPI001110EA82|nr:polyketide synthase [Streptomyces sp. YIM 121038]QCX82550.1 Putative polyketide biosynthesis enoyl-CoA isomerase PksI [Streptomyces sp. YIM 121038]